MCLNELETILLLKIAKVPILIDYANAEEGKIYTLFPVFIVNSEETIKFFDLPVKNDKLENFLKEEYNFLHELLEKEIITVKDLKEILQYY